jgi:glycosyltransferase involved in cell wall biosynthesis
MLLRPNQTKVAARVVVVGPLPPPRNGMAIVDGYVSKALADAGLLIETCDTANSIEGPARHLDKLKKTFRAIGTLYARRATENRTLLHPCDARSGKFYTLGLCAAARVLGYRIFLHHHSFFYINKFSPLIAVINRVMGKSGRHIILCDCMDKAFHARYPQSIAGPMRSIVVGNEIWYPPPAPDRPPPGQTISIGHFGNLTWEKGSGTFLDLFDDLRDRGVDVHAYLMGLATDPALNEKLEKSRARHGDRLHMLDSTDQEARKKFYASIDFFVMPTQYKVEAQPLVLIEAGEHGIPLISIDLGCIGEDHDHAPNLIVSPNDDFVGVVGPWLAERKFEARTDRPAPRQRTINSLADFVALFSGDRDA